MTAFILVNLAYTINVVALAVSDVLWLRLLLLPGQAAFLAWGVTIANTPTVAWNALFMVINGWQLWRLYQRRRPLDLPDTLEQIRLAVFAEMSTREFLHFWETGEPHRVFDRQLIREGEVPDTLYLVTSGHCNIYRKGRHIAAAGRGQFIAEMSFLTGAPATADVQAAGAVELISWSHAKLEMLENLDKELYLRVHKALSRDVTRKALEAKLPD